MPSAFDNFRKILIFPKTDFGSEEAVADLAGIDWALDRKFLLFDYIVIAAILHADGRIFWPATLFLLNIARRSGSVTGDTVRTYSESLLTFLNFLSERNLRDSDVTEEQWGSFRAYLRFGSRKYARNTANLHLNVASGYLRWGQESGQCCSQFGERLMEIQKSWRRDFWGHRSFDPRNEVVQLPSVKRQPKFVSPSDFQRIAANSPLPYRLMFKWAICTGLRRFEICSLRLADLDAAKLADGKNNGLVHLEIVRKGGRLRSVYVPAALIEETRWYVLVDRVRPAPGFEQDVFLNSNGRRISRQSLTRRFREVANRINLSATLHHLRHTFAIQVLARLQKFEDAGEPINALKSLQILLGHSSLETSEIYLDAMDVTSDAVADTLGYLYGAAL